MSEDISLETTGATPPKDGMMAIPPTKRLGDDDATAPGDYVACLQGLLTARKHAPGPYGCDGIFGPSTEGALKAVQELLGLVPDGICGPHSWNGLLHGPITSV
jgi:peptidoglycan hydrolase-like protein with peptidoglycan-binding domain